MGLDHADDHIFAAAVAADGLAQHAVGLANAGRIAEKELEDSAFLCGAVSSSHCSGVFRMYLILRQRPGIVDSYN